LCPSAYKKSQGLNYQNPHAGQQPLWSAKSIGDILQNRMYVGDMVQGKQRVKSYKIHTQEQVPAKEWFIVKNTHQPIIARDLFESVQELLKRDTRTAPQQKKLYLFSGFLRCADCGKALARSEVKGTVYYFCRTYKNQSKTACTKHSLKHERLEAAVLYAIQQHIYAAVNYSKISEELSAAPLQKSRSLRLDILAETKEKELAKIRRYKQTAYQDWKDGEITQSDYRQMSEDYEQQIQAVKTVLDNLTAERAGLANGMDTENPFLVSFRKFENIVKLTRDVVIELVDQIKVHENSNVSIKLKFPDEIRRIMAYIEIKTDAV
jgi:sulfur transfer complex TusBCD TusB component (DsrH family)